MGLSPVFKTKQSVISSYITLLLSDSNIQAALWQFDNQKITILSKSSIHRYSDDQQAVTQADLALQDLGKQSEEINDVIFGLPHTWIEGQDVTTVKKPLLKVITEELDLKAVGFVVTSEAVAKYLIANNPRISMLLVEFSQYELYLSLISQGELIGTKYVGRSGDTIADMAEALARLNASQEEEINLPAKMMLSSLDLNDSELQDQQQLLLNHDWVNSHPFPYPPTVDLLDQEIILEAVIEQGKSSPVEQSVAKSQVVIPVRKEEPEVTGKIEKDTLAVEVKPQKTVATSYGVPIKLDDLDKKIQPEIGLQNELNLPHPIESKKKSSSKIKMKFYSWFKEHRLFAIGGFFAGILALVLIVGAWLNMGVKAAVKLSLVVESISKETTITLNPDIDSTDVDKLVLAAHTIEKKVSGKKTKETTGVKVVGDKATGKVTIFNTTNGEKFFDKGTVLVKGNLEFTLDEEVRVASASVQKSNGTTEYGKNEVAVTAAGIGAESNLNKEIELQIEKFDTGTYYAVVADTFTGGSSREVKVVSVGDQNQLVENLRQQLLDEAQEEVTKNIEEGEYIASASIYKVDEQQIDAEIGDEIGTVTLDLSVVVKVLTYKTEDLKPLAQKVLEADVPEGYTLANSDPQIMSTPNQEASGSGLVNLVVNISSEAKPDLDLAELKQDILGKRIDEAKQILTAKDDIDSVEINLIPWIAIQLYPRIPKDPAKIEIQ